MELFSSPEFLSLAMVAGICLSLLIGFPVALSLAGSALLFAFIGYVLGVFDFSFISGFPQRIFAIIRNEVLVAVPLFIFMGVVLERSKIAEDLLGNVGLLFGRFPGGLGYSVFIVGALMAASTGIVGATVVTMGLLSLPIMLKSGYRPSLACGSICASGTLGQVIPPSIVLVLLGDQLATAYQEAQYKLGNFSPGTVSVNDLFAGALIPGLLLVGFYMLYLTYVAIRHPQAVPPIKSDVEVIKDAQFYKKLFESLFPPIFLIVAVLGSILAGIASPTESASVGAIGSLMLAGYKNSEKARKPIVLALTAFILMLMLTLLFDLRLQRNVISTTEYLVIALAIVLAFILLWGVFQSLMCCFTTIDAEKNERMLAYVIRETVTHSTMVFTILIGAGMFSLVFRGFGGDVMVEEFLAHLPGGTISVLLVVMLTMFLLGFILDFLEIVFIVVPIVAPILLMMEIEPGVIINPVWLGVMMAVNLQTSFLTPPFGFSLFYLRGVAPASVKTTEIYKGVIPFVLIQIAMLVFIWFFPEVATWLPEAIYGK